MTGQQPSLDVLKRYLADSQEAGDPQFVVELDGDVVGIARTKLIEQAADDLSGAEKKLRLSFIAIDPTHQGRGLGTALLQAVEDIAVELGATQIALDVWPHNYRAAALYKRFGFQPLGQAMGLRPRRSQGQHADA